MARRHEAGQYLLEGLNPYQIAGRMGLSLSSVRQYLCTLVGEGQLLHADIAFAIEERHLIEDVLRSSDETPANTTPLVNSPYGNLQLAGSVHYALRQKGQDIARDLIELYLTARDPRPDLYALICSIEVLLHRLVKQTLQAAHGDRWWRDGIPEPVRKNCQSRKEEDETPLEDPYRYTTFIELKSIIECNWSVFSVALPKALAANKPETQKRLQRLNNLRKQVMHPVKEISEYDASYRFARSCLSDFEHLRWRIDQAQRSKPVQP